MHEEMNIKEIKNVTLYKAAYKGKSKIMHTHKAAIIWIAKQVMLDVIYGDWSQDYIDNTQRFQDWMIVKKRVVDLLLDNGTIEQAIELILNYLQYEYNPLTYLENY